MRTAICRNSSSRISEPSREPKWPPLPSPTWRSSSGRSPWRALLFGPACRFRRRPTCSPRGSRSLVRAGINDWGGVSPVTPDHVNPEAPWPHLAGSRAQSPTRPGGIWSSDWRSCPPMRRGPKIWTDPAITPRVRRLSDSRGFARPDRWYAGVRRRIAAVAARWSIGRRRSPSMRRLKRTPRQAAGIGAIIACGARRPRADRGGHRAALQRRRPRSRCGDRRGGSVAPRIGRRHGHLRHQPEHQLHQHLPVPLRFLRILQGPRGSKICAAPPTISNSTRSRAARSRRRTPARPRCACRAAFIRASPARPI